MPIKNGHEATIVADVVKQGENADPNNTIDCAFAVLRKAMVSEWDLCTGPDPHPQPQTVTRINRDVFSGCDRPVHGKIKHSTLVSRWDDNEAMTFYFTGLTSGRMKTTIIYCNYHFKYEGSMYCNLLVLVIREHWW